MTRIAVLGAGVSGLTSAVALLEAGHRVQLVAAEPSLATTSALAAAVWFPTHVGPRERSHVGAGKRSRCSPSRPRRGCREW